MSLLKLQRSRQLITIKLSTARRANDVNPSQSIQADIVRIEGDMEVNALEIRFEQEDIASKGAKKESQADDNVYDEDMEFLPTLPPRGSRSRARRLACVMGDRRSHNAQTGVVPQWSLSRPVKIVHVTGY
ncbi:hypothetical protein V493_04882 [Pseudogymnoascus sp. VKM F-4281 (FW-2241)]|nr:hypothetical protein V493_04882 [Pseudogymnoascus sp. VKM F-4281 (FW-2241)]